MIKISLTALFAALIAAGAFIAIPIGPVPIVLQNMFAVLSGLVLGPVMGSAAVGLYLLAGLLNLPVFAGGGGGIARFAGPTGGFLVGYLLAALIAGLIPGRPVEGSSVSRVRLIAAVIASFLVVYLPGLIWLKIRLDLNLTATFTIGFLPFVPGDIIKAVAAVLIAPRLRKIAGDYLNKR
ncbi:MAG: biotin transporter BioY [Treponema sp.]|nr:biotin transporter BioY [Treponema sp.]